MGQGVFFFVVAPFCSCPASLVSRKFFAVGPGCAKCFFFLLRSVGHRDLSAGRGQSKKKNTTQGVFFCSGPGKRQGKEKPRWAPARGHFFFALAPCRRLTGLLLPLPFPGAPWVVFFFLLWPRAGAQRGFSFPCLSPGPQQKKTPWVVFFFCSGPVPARGFSFPAFRRGRSKKKKHPGWCFFFFCCGPARTLTHSLRAWVAMPPPRRGGVFFLLRPRPDRGGVFFFCCGPARTLTHSLWAGAISARPGWCFFFAAAPPGLFRQ